MRGSQTSEYTDDGREPSLIVFSDPSSLAEGVAARFLDTLQNVIAAGNQPVHVCLTGGTVGIAVLAATAKHAARKSVDWSRVHFWWGDERWLPAGHPERNDHQADVALIDRLEMPPDNVHWCPAQHEGLTLADAAMQYANELKRHAPEGHAGPLFDVTFLGMGPDGHIASLFPHHPEVRENTLGVVAVRNSPKPPPQRLSLTLPMINASKRVWVVVAGNEKAHALKFALSRTDVDETPAAGLSAGSTKFFVDAAAATETGI